MTEEDTQRMKSDWAEMFPNVPFPEDDEDVDDDENNDFYRIRNKKSCLLLMDITEVIVENTIDDDPLTDDRWSQNPDVDPVVRFMMFYKMINVVNLTILEIRRQRHPIFKSYFEDDILKVSVEDEKPISHTFCNTCKFKIDIDEQNSYVGMVNDDKKITCYSCFYKDEDDKQSIIDDQNARDKGFRELSNGKWVRQ